MIFHSYVSLPEGTYSQNATHLGGTCGESPALDETLPRLPAPRFAPGMKNMGDAGVQLRLQMDTPW